MDIRKVPQTSNFEEGAQYLRKELHDQFKGQRQYGISTPAQYSFIFIFADPHSEEHGYTDEFQDNGNVIYSGEGQEGDMKMEGGNKRIRDHKENNEALYVFKREGERGGADVYSYVGEYEYTDHHWEKAPDEKGRKREAIRFTLTPVSRKENP